MNTNNCQGQGSQTRGPRAACGLPDVFAARDIIKTTQIIDKTTFFKYKGIFSLQLWSAETFFFLMRPASPFLLKCGPCMKLSLRPLV